MSIPASISAFLASSMLLAAAAPTGPIGIVYSVDRAPDSALVTASQNEMARLVEPTGLSLAWRNLASDGPGEFRDVFILRFRGDCSLQTHRRRPEGNTRRLGDTQISEGRVLSFADVRCDAVRQYLAGANAVDEPALASALARVAAHELFHMLTHSAKHPLAGIARAEFTPTDLLSPGFQFAPAQVGRIRYRAGGDPGDSRPLR